MRRRPFLLFLLYYAGSIESGRIRGKKGGHMRFMHIADVHLGAQPDAGPLYSGRRAQEIWDTFEKVIRVCETEQTDLLLIAGDLFHRQPLVRELKEVNYLFSGLTHTKVVIIAGNHDYIGSSSYYRTFQWSENVYPLFGKTPEYIEFPELDTAVYGFSYHQREIREPMYDHLRAGGVRPIEILLAHGGDETHIPIDRRALSASGFAYVALGHIHKPQALEKDRMIYAGALEPIDKNDVGAHGYVKGRITEQGVRTQWIPCASREYIHLEFPVEEEDTTGSIRDEIRQMIEEYGSENMYKITLTGGRAAEIVFDTKRMEDAGNILSIVDETFPAYDIPKLYEENRDNILGRYIARFAECEEGSVEYEALCEGVEALLGSRL